MPKSADAQILWLTLHVHRCGTCGYGGLTVCLLKKIHVLSGPVLFSRHLYSESKVWESFMIGKYSDVKGPSMLMTTDPSNCSGIVYINPEVTC